MNTPAYYLLAGRHDDGAPIQPMHISGPLGCHYIGSAIDYVMRAGRKPGAAHADDLRKALAWLDALELSRKLHGVGTPAVAEVLRYVRRLVERQRAAEPGLRSDCLYRLVDAAAQPSKAFWLDSARGMVRDLWAELDAAALGAGEVLNVPV